MELLSAELLGGRVGSAIDEFLSHSVVNDCIRGTKRVPAEFGTMPLYQIEDSLTLREIKHKSFQEVDIKERQHLQVLVRDNVNAIDSDLLIIAEEFHDFDNSSRRLDLLGLDSSGNLVVIELKRVDDGSHMELQAIRYAAMVAPMDLKTVIDTYREYLSSRGLPSDSAEAVIRQFLKNSVEEISSTPRIILVSPTFSKEITTTALWLNDRGLTVKCIQARPYQLDGKLYLDIEQLIPLSVAEEYQISIGKKQLNAERQSTGKRSEKTMSILEEEGILANGTKLELVRLPRPNMIISDDRAKQATYLGEGLVRWEYDGQSYSLTGLCKRLCAVFGAQVGTFAGPDYWAIAGESTVLYQRAKALSTE